jgi:hypothetical protein
VLTNTNHTLKVRVTGTKNASAVNATIVADRIDVTTPAPVTPTVTATLVPTATPVPLVGAAACTNVFIPSLDANFSPQTTQNTNLYYDLNGAASYYKIKNSSYYGRGGLSSIFPANYQSYDADDLPLVGYFNRGDDATTYNGVGVVVTNGTQTVGVSGASGGISPRGWADSTYSVSTSPQIGSRFTTYIKSRRDFTPITGLTDAAFTSKTTGMFLITGDLTIAPANASAFNNKSVLIAVTGNIHINTDIIPTGGTVGFSSANIYINESVSEVRALLTADSVSLVSSGFASTSAVPLKVVGSITSGTVVNTAKRIRPDAFKPSFFLVTDPDLYVILLPYISNVKYDWKQLQ